ncbi:MAG: molybdenum cofactor biosynthesis protein B [Gammaproteobacteria bacterium]|nr:molybdenum cofactor biosynthesis protein B [Gammaproteobacteria bacterium]
MAHDHTTHRDLVPLNIAILTVSDSRSEKNDRSGRLLVSRLEQTGHRTYQKLIVPDDKYQIRTAISHWISDEQVQIVITTGGTGLTGRDGTPEAVAPLLDKTMDGFGEMFRMMSFETIATSSLQSRAIAGVANGTFIFCLPGSTGACADGWDKIIVEMLDYRTQPCNLVELMPRLLET